MSESQSRLALSRYRPLAYLLTGVAAAYAIVYIHNYILSPSSNPGLRRRRALRRRRRNEPDHPEVTDTPSSLAIAHLEQLERQNGVYGTFRIETEDGRRVESGLLPSLLATRDQLMEEVGVPPAHAERMREMMEDTFLESFLALDFPPTHTLEESSEERNYLMEQLQRRGISRAGIERALARFNEDSNYGEELRRRRQNGERVTLSASTFPDESQPAQNMDGAETVVDDQSVLSWRDGNNDDSPTREGQNLLNLLYHIAEDQSRRDGYIHRGVTCNSCGAMPIQGIRYRCANCIDYDLCETCEAMQVHIKTHLFYKVRIPAPFLGSPRQSQPAWYPGKPAMLPRSLPRALAKRLMKESAFENTELDALWDQFRCLANHEWADDPNKLYMAIDRKTFDRCFVPNTSIRPPPPSLIYDRMFAFYDTNSDGLIGFEEFLKGLASLNNKSNDERLRRVFRGYDIDGDGYVERKDFLRVFRAFYTLSRELTRDMVAGMEDDFLEGGARDVVLGSQPISSAFPGSIPSGEPSRAGEGKRMTQNGDLELVDNEGILRPDGTDTGDRHTVIGDAAVRSQFGTSRPIFPRLSSPPRDTAVEQSSLGPNGASLSDAHDDGSSDGTSSSSAVPSHWPGVEHIRSEDVVAALGAFVPPQEITDPVDRARVRSVVFNRMFEEEQRQADEFRRQGIDERWRRRSFYTDEEDGGDAPENYRSDSSADDLSDSNDGGEEEEDEDHDSDEAVSHDDDSQDYESHPPSPRSRSSSKVRFQDDLTDDYDVRSNPSTSSRSILVGERWGGFEVPEVEKDVGKEILYQVTQQGFNELLDILFKPKEDLLMEVRRTRAERKIWAHEIELAERVDPRNHSSREQSDGLDDDQPRRSTYTERPLGELLDRAGYSIRSPSPSGELSTTGPILDPPSPRLRASSDDDDVRPTHLAHPDDEDEDDEEEENEDEGDGLDDQPEIIAPVPLSARPRIITEEHRPVSPSESDYYDPTLPHHRPNDEEEAAAAAATEQATNPLPHPYSTPASPSHPDLPRTLPPNLTLQPTTGTTSFPAPTISSPEAEATAPKLSPSPIQALPSSTTASLPPNGPAASLPPSPVTLSRWAYLNHVEREAKARGGAGAKLNFEEFSRRMAADRGRRLAFVASWIEMASF